MADYVELELGIYRIDGNRYALRFQLWEPGSPVINTLLSRPVDVQFDRQALLLKASSSTDYGAALTAQLFADPAAQNAFTRARAVAETLKCPLRLRLYIEPAAVELQDLRWETLFDSDRGVSLCMDENLLFSRFLSSDSPQPFDPAVVDRMKALVVISSPSDLADYGMDPIDIEAELARAKAGLGDTDLTVLAGGGKANLNNMADALRGGCSLFYLVAHGRIRDNCTDLYLEGPDGKADVVDGSDLINRVRELQSLPLMALLVSCQSAGSGTEQSNLVEIALGPRLAEAGIPAVMAMQGKITFPTLQSFLPKFFSEVQRDGVMDRALAVARGTVRDRGDWWVPVLFSRLRDNRLLQPAPAAQPLELAYFEPETVYIPAGKFIMGRDPDGIGAAWESPRHEVTLGAYRIGKYPVTNRQYLEYVRKTNESVNPEMRWNGQAPPPEILDCPVAGVTWYQSLRYCQWLSKETGRKYNLPNEAQWEKAARGAQGWLYPWGPDWAEGRCNTDPSKITPIGTYPPQSIYGCCDMVGNVREWTLSLWGDKRSAPDPAYAYPWKDDGRSDPGANPLIRRIYRGGASTDPAAMTCTSRFGYAPDQTGPIGNKHGFRVVMLLE